jgi:hypothetical protein
MKDDMKKEGTRLNNWDGGDVKHGRRELQQNKVLQNLHCLIKPMLL